MEHNVDKQEEYKDNLTKKIYWASGIVSICGIIFEVLFGAAGSYILGDGVKQYTITIGLFLTGMGIGASLSERILKQLMAAFVWIEFAIALIGGTSILFLFGVMAFIGSGVEALFLYGVTVVIGALTGLELPILIRKATEIGTQLNRSAARVLFSDYAGSLIGAILFVILLRPSLGLVKTAFVVALINLLAGVWMLFVFRKEIRRWRLLRGIAIILLFIMVGGILFGQEAAFSFEQKLYKAQIVETLDTPYQRIVVTREMDDIRLFIDGNLQFSTSDEYRYHESLVHVPLSLARNKAKVLILGGGDGLVARELLKYPEIKEITLVDLDEMMVNFSRTSPLLTEVNQGSLDNQRVKLVFSDAFQFLLQTDEMYDVVIGDLPDPNNESLNKLYTREFYSLIGKRLMPGGILVVQATSPLFARDVYWTISETVKSAGFNVLNYHVDIPSFGDWGFVIGARENLDTSNIQLPEIPLRYLTQKVIPSLFVFGKDEDNPGGLDINTIDHSILVPMYEKAWRYY
ncbi:polyamine aminopropyltransferase [Microaerobacter geothermalis]|uniref:polyamine aminopropyltransferase n=1 Tax=Microaerobacter geothermalis TaxID=674972 RepID=UPI001F21F851|nr:polyamine aminopropyltransferase [Microaerobacter geothermalis]MCF6092558.1 polyamine aminopropyltransferase [Microaerobacter geothermalis]